jgi:hypothetical protein
LPRAEYNPRSTYGIAKDRVPACARAPPVWTPSHGHAWNRPDHIVLRVVLLCRARSTTAPRLHLAPRCSAQQWPSCSCDCGGLKRSRRIGQIRFSVPSKNSHCRPTPQWIKSLLSCTQHETGGRMLVPLLFNSSLSTCFSFFFAFQSCVSIRCLRIYAPVPSRSCLVPAFNESCSCRRIASTPLHPTRSGRQFSPKVVSRSSFARFIYSLCQFSLRRVLGAHQPIVDNR